MSRSDARTRSTNAFDTTDWTVVMEASKRGEPGSRDALAELVRAYWQPLYSYTRRLGHSPESAQDMTQEFFTRMMEKDFLGKADPARGRFRNFLLTAYKRFLGDERDKRRAQKRGGGVAHVRLDYKVAETTWRLDPGHDETPERLFERQWAQNLLARALDALRDEYAAKQDGGRFEALRPFLTAEHPGVPYKRLAEDLDLTPGALRVMMYRLRQRYRLLLEREIVKTTGPDADLEAEVCDLFRALGH
jgi:RNA polymerase sigma-70 factor (ECF subfamily)